MIPPRPGQSRRTMWCAGCSSSGRDWSQPHGTCLQPRLLRRSPEPCRPVPVLSPPLGDRVHSLHGITAVTREERRYFGSRGVMIAPWEPEVPAARAALTRESGQHGVLVQDRRSCGPWARRAILVTPRGTPCRSSTSPCKGRFRALPLLTTRRAAGPRHPPLRAALAEFLPKVGATARQFVWGRTGRPFLP